MNSIFNNYPRWWKNQWVLPITQHDLAATYGCAIQIIKMVSDFILESIWSLTDNIKVLITLIQMVAVPRTPSKSTVIWKRRVPLVSTHPRTPPNKIGGLRKHLVHGSPNIPKASRSIIMSLILNSNSFDFFRHVLLNNLSTNVVQV